MEPSLDIGLCSDQIVTRGKDEIDLTQNYQRINERCGLVAGLEMRWNTILAGLLLALEVMGGKEWASLSKTSRWWGRRYGRSV